MKVLGSWTSLSCGRCGGCIIRRSVALSELAFAGKAWREDSKLSESGKTFSESQRALQGLRLKDFFIASGLRTCLS